jgi:hypothetical protein
VTLSPLQTLASIGITISVAVCAACAASPASVQHGDTTGGDDDSKKPASTFERDGSVYDSAPDPNTGLGQLRFMPSAVFSGVDSEHTFKVPIAVYDASTDLEVTADDPAAVTVTPTALEKPTNNGTFDSGKYFMIEMKKAGRITLTASSKGKTASAVIQSTQYDSQRWAAGEKRYMSAGTSSDPPCTLCHAGGTAIDHSPATMAAIKDQDIGLIIVNGIKPGRVIGGVNCPECSTEGGKHRWRVTEAEKNGLITYLRSLEPNGFK